ncbi:hypothetical protein [Prochlorococcus sp. MIT 0602]|uniref:hypothetical protein n=1 Tax=unclassified Prochlorococcus TaxID=2627481 RepID=UPI00053392DA|nr:hypothetical protein EV06_0914 [Prochlorococcus sp. MIT 0602]KGG17322.1 hypothetical protein EV07_0760 [Prochlorococcus sp. MIT 0603]
MASLKRLNSSFIALQSIGSEVSLHVFVQVILIGMLASMIIGYYIYTSSVFFQGIYLQLL